MWVFDMMMFGNYSLNNAEERIGFCEDYELYFFIRL